MSKPRRIRTPLILLATVSAVLALSAGCSKQGEGERCSIAANFSEDCEDGLVCTAASTLNNPEGTPVDRCCPPPGEKIGDARCLPNTGTPGGGTGGTGGTGGSAGASSEGGTAEGGLSSTGGNGSTGGDTGGSTGGGSTGGSSSTGGDTGTGGA
jgi:hypothetical protein